MAERFIERVRGPFERARVDLELRGAHKPYVVSDREGRWWVLKPLPPRGVLAECVGALLGDALGVDIPEFAVFDEEGIGRGWLSELITGAHHWDGSWVGPLLNTKSVGRMVVLDALIFNEDRNPENFLLEIEPEDRSYRCWAIDMESALVSMPRALASRGHEAPRAHALPPDLELEPDVREAARAGAEVAATLGPEELEEIVRASAEVAGTLDGDRLASSMVSRCRRAAQIVEDYLDEIERRPRR